MKHFQQKIRGVTLIEVLLVLVIMASVIFMISTFVQQKTEELRRDRAAMQMQMILNAGMAFYLASNINGPTWPAAGPITVLQPTYLPAGTIISPWGTNYTITSAPTDPLFKIEMSIPAGNASVATAKILAGRLPLATVSGSTVTTAVPIPGQNLNNARAVNFASLYNTGACVPKPSCPLGMTPQIFVVPVSVSGASDNNSFVYPISSYTGFARDINGTNVGSAVACDGVSTTACAGLATPAAGVSGYWRVCLSVTTEKGLITTASVLTGTVLAITRCMPVAEEVGSPLGVAAP